MHCIVIYSVQQNKIIQEEVFDILDKIKAIFAKFVEFIWESFSHINSEFQSDISFGSIVIALNSRIYFVE